MILLLFGISKAEYEAPVIDPNDAYDPSAKIFMEPGAPRNMLPYIHRETMEHLKFVPTEMDNDIAALIKDQADYITWNYMFDEDFMQGLRREMQWVDERYSKDFIDSKIKRNFGKEVPDG